MKKRVKDFFFFFGGGGGGLGGSNRAHRLGPAPAFTWESRGEEKGRWSHPVAFGGWRMGQQMGMGGSRRDVHVGRSRTSPMPILLIRHCEFNGDDLRLNNA